jgi:hypothetical protein
MPNEMKERLSGDVTFSNFAAFSWRPLYASWAVLRLLRNRYSVSGFHQCQSCCNLQ